MLLETTYFLNKKQSKYISIYLDRDLTPHVKIGSYSHRIVMDQLVWHILTALKDDVKHSTIHKLGDTDYALDVYRVRYFRITNYEEKVCLSKREWTYLLHLSTCCINRQLCKLDMLYDDLKLWYNSVINLKEFCTHNNTNFIDYEVLYDEVFYKLY
jgi:hypothetical protein